MEIGAHDLVASIESIEVEDGSLVECAVVLVKVSNADGTSSLHRAGTPGMSHWEGLGMLYDSLDGMRTIGDWSDD